MKLQSLIIILAVAMASNASYAKTKNSEISAVQAAEQEAEGFAKAKAKEDEKQAKAEAKAEKKQDAADAKKAKAEKNADKKQANADKKKAEQKAKGLSGSGSESLAQIQGQQRSDAEALAKQRAEEQAARDAAERAELQRVSDEAVAELAHTRMLEANAAPQSITASESHALGIGNPKIYFSIENDRNNASTLSPVANEGFTAIVDQDAKLKSHFATLQTDVLKQLADGQQQMIADAAKQTFGEDAEVEVGYTVRKGYDCINVRISSSELTKHNPNIKFVERTLEISRIRNSTHQASFELIAKMIAGEELGKASKLSRDGRVTNSTVEAK